MTRHSFRILRGRFAFVFLLIVVPQGLAEGAEWSPAAPLERVQEDWMFQDHGLDIEACFASKGNAHVETAMVEKVLAELGGDAAALFNQRMQALLGKKTPGADPTWKTLYLDACEARRRQRLAPLVAKYPQVVFTKHYNLGGSHYAYTENPTDAQRSERGGTNPDWRMGASLCLMEIAEDGTAEFRTLHEAPEGVIRDPDVSYDGKSIVFSKRNSAFEDDYHIYEMNVETGEIHQLTHGLGFADDEPCYLPNGDVLFNSTRCMQIVDCWWTDVTNLYTCDRQGRFLRRVTFDQVHTNYPKVLDDGRVIYTRWDYNDRGQIYPQPLFVMNCDGTGQTDYYGNNSWFPTTIMHARGIPGTQKLVAVASGHHSHQRGKLITIDRMKGSHENEGVQLIAPVRETPAEKIDAYGQHGDQFQYPYPLDETHFLVTYCPIETDRRAYARSYGVYFMDIDGRRELLAFDEDISCNQPVPLAERELPPLRPSMVDHSRDTGTYYVQDVYFGPGLEGVQRGVVKSLRVIGLEFRAAGVHSNRNGGPAGGALVSTPIGVNNATWDVKHVLGTVPVEEDGSAYFEVPAKTPVYFQLLDEDGHVVQTMRSWSTLQPGENFSCLGCHEDKNAAQPSGANPVTMALRQGARKLEPFHGPARGFSYRNEIQPIWDKHCIGCHTGGKTEDGKDAPFSLLGNDVHDNGAGRYWSESYVNLTQNGKPNELVNWMNVQSIPPMIPPYFAGAAKSRLMTHLREGHNDVKLSRRELELIACWIDLLVPYCGDYEEANAWSDHHKAEYAYYLGKRNRMADIDRKNIKSLLATMSGEAPPTEWETFTGGGPEAKKDHHEAAKQRLRELPVVGRLTGDENVYRNVALNVEASQGEPTSYPHASTNSECRGMAAFAAKNVIDGKSANTGHGPKFPSWGPDRRTDLWCKIDFGRPVEIDKAVITLRADFPHDDYWRTATLEFSDGTTMPITFKKTADAQTFTFDRRRVEWVRITDLKEEMPLGWCGLTEVEVWGQDMK